MTKLIKLTQAVRERSERPNKPIWINPHWIVAMEDDDNGGTRLALVNWETMSRQLFDEDPVKDARTIAPRWFAVEETVDEILQAIERRPPHSPGRRNVLG
jgi:hypothetical protein